jgi:hypothetical protein
LDSSTTLAGALLVTALLVSCRAPSEPPADEPPGDATPEDRSQATDAATDTADPAEGVGRWRRFARKRYERLLTPQQRREMEQLQAIGYLQGSTEAPGLVGVTRYDRDRAEGGLNYYNAGHEPSAFLMDMRGRVLHEWSAAFDDIWPGAEVTGDRRSLRFWRRVRPLPNGDLLVVFDGHGIARLDRDSRVIWQRLNGAHHDLDIAPNGDIFVLVRTSHVVPRVNDRHPILEDFVEVLDSAGRDKARISLLEAFENSDEYCEIWDLAQRNVGDIFHTNTVELLDGLIADRLPAFAAGNVLISVRFLDAVAVVDLGLGQVVWAATGDFLRQHDPTILDDGNLLLFDNVGPKRYSAVQEYDPVSMELLWEYRGSRRQPLHSHTCGTAQRLPGGNTLITESDAGRAFEVTRDGEIVWEFFNPHRAGENGKYIATLFELRRLPPEFPTDWARGESSSIVPDTSPRPARNGP